MTKNLKKAGLYWKSNRDWYHINPETKWPEINDDAPEEAKESFEQRKIQRGFSDVEII